MTPHRAACEVQIQGGDHRNRLPEQVDAGPLSGGSLHYVCSLRVTSYVKKGPLVEGQRGRVGSMGMMSFPKGLGRSSRTVEKNVDENPIKTDDRRTAAETMMTHE